MQLTLTEWVMAILVGSMVLVLLFTMISRATRLGIEARSAARRVRCRLCLHVFESVSTPGPVECPKCGAANERGRSRSLG